jgi:uncharacterized RDD family membrane protein YckC
MSTAGQRYRRGVATRLVTPEAVVLGFDTAGLPTRLLARLLDVIGQAALLFAVVFGLGFLGVAGVPDVALTISVLFLAPLIIFGYPIAFESLWRGRTLGKAALGLRVVTVEGAPIRFRHALIRGGADFVDLYGLGLALVAPGIVGVIVIAASKRSQRLGDIVAGTIVVRERTGATPTAPAFFTVPPGYESYAATVDVSGLDGRDYQAVRAYLLRAANLRPEARGRVATDLARTIAARARHVPPPGVSPDLFLAVVAANVQARGGERPVAAAPPSLVPGGWGAVPTWRGAAPLGPPTAAGGWGAAPSWPGAVPAPSGAPVPVAAAAPAPSEPPRAGGFAAPS